jgi:hypothetical protein
MGQDSKSSVERRTGTHAPAPKNGEWPGSRRDIPQPSPREQRQPAEQPKRPRGRPYQEHQTRAAGSERLLQILQESPTNDYGRTQIDATTLAATLSRRLKWYGSTFATLRPSGKLNMFLAGAEEYRTSSTNEPSCESHEETHELREHTYPVSLQTREQISFFQFEKPRTGAGSQDDCGIGQCIAQQTGCTSSTRRNGLLMKSSSPDKTNSRNDGIAESSTRQEQRTREQLDALADIIRMLRAHRSERLAHVEATQPAPSPTEPATTTDLNTDTVLP